MKRLALTAIIFTMLTGCASILLKPDLDRRAAYLESHPNLSESVRDCISKGQIKLGMTEEEVIASWGRPDRKNRSVGRWGVHEQWVYNRVDRHGIPYTDPMWYIYFENGVVTSMQGPGR